MRVITVTGAGGPEVLALGELPVPHVGRRDVLIRVAFAGVNRADLLLQAQQAPVPSGWSVVPGLEVSGTVAAVGAAVRELSPGDEVMALSLGGGYAEYCAVDASLVLKRPADLSLQQAAGVPEAAATIWTSLIDRGRPRRGERVLITGGASVIGTLAIALAVRAGCRVTASAGTDEKCAAARSAGAAAVVNYRDPSAARLLREASANAGFDLILDMGGGDTLAQSIDLLAPRGRLVLIGMMAGRTGTVDMLPLMAKRASVLGSTLFFRTRREKAAALRKGWARAATLLQADGAFPLHIDAEYPLEQAAAAQRRLDAPDHRGKVVIRLLQEGHGRACG